MNEQLRICVIDDDVILLKALATGLREAGCLVRTAPGAAAGLDLVERDGADVIVTDMNMPGTSGAELIAEARARWPTMPIIAMTGLGTIDGVSALEVAQMRGASTLLHKPLRVANLLAAIAPLTTASPI